MSQHNDARKLLQGSVISVVEHIVGRDIDELRLTIHTGETILITPRRYSESVGLDLRVIDEE